MTVKQAIEHAVHYAVNVVGEEGIRKMSWFPSSRKVEKGQNGL